MAVQQHNQDPPQDLCCSNTDLVSLGPSPINVDFLLKYLADYPLFYDVHILAEGFSNGFSLQYDGPRQFRECDNLL